MKKQSKVVTQLDREKREWLQSIGAMEFPEPIKFVYTFPNYNGAFNLTERYVRETPLEELKKQYIKNEAYVKEIFESRKTQDNFRLACLVEKGFSKHLMEKSGMIRYVYGKKKIRIEIEYNSDSDKGKMKVIALE